MIEIEPEVIGCVEITCEEQEWSCLHAIIKESIVNFDDIGFDFHDVTLEDVQALDAYFVEYDEPPQIMDESMLLKLLTIVSVTETTNLPDFTFKYHYGIVGQLLNNDILEKLAALKGGAKNAC